jgi:hypothetical protein
MDDYILYISLLLITIIIVYQLYKVSKEEYKNISSLGYSPYYTTNKKNINLLPNINHLARYLL